MTAPTFYPDVRREVREDLQKRKSFVARHEWTIIGLLALVCFVLGCIGYAQVLEFGSEEGQYTPWDVVYASLQLFIFEAGDATAGWPLYLQVARAMAPMIVLYSAALAVWSKVGEQVSLYTLLLYKRRFVVVCGVGETGFRIAKDYCFNSDKRVVVVDLDPQNALAAELAGYGAIVVCGNAMDPLVLMRAQVAYAKEVFLCTSDDKVNIAIAKTAERITRSLKTREVSQMERIAAKREKGIGDEPPSISLRCFICVDTPDIFEVFQKHSFFETNSTRFSILLFNRRETMARNIFRVCAPDLYHRPHSQDDPRMHVLIIGFEALARELILQIALTAHYTDFRKPQITVLCRGQREESTDRFLYRFPHLREVVDIDFLFEDPLTLHEDKWYAMQTESAFQVCYVAMQNDVEGILSARRLNRLRRLMGRPPLNFVVCLNQQNTLAEIIDDDFLPIEPDKRALPDHEPIEYFETLDYTLSIDVVVNDELDVMARALHYAYLRAQSVRGESDNASVAPWSELPPHKKKANQNAASHMDVKLRLCNCTALSRHAADPDTEFPPSNEMLEKLAQLEHRRWMADKYLSGYSYGDTRDEDRMLHPDLVPWESLSESDKDKDRENILAIPGLLDSVDQKLCLLRS
ncbi:TrkA-N domain family protein [gamma proteobacterium NOR5-3]|nr:TrkA-N domain family protein [gamma proteobacterium NOR5-3]